MAGNDWINGYLEAILDAGAASKPKAQPFSSSSSNNSLSLSSPDAVEAAAGVTPASRFSPARYFVEEVVSRFDDADLHKTWIKVVAKRNSQERSARMENMCWRIWHLARKKKRMEWDEARRRLEQVKRSRDAAEDLSSELSEGEREKGSSSTVESPTISRLESAARIWSPEEEDESGKPNRLYIVLISMHGLVRGENMELGRDSDTGGQVIPPGMDFSGVKAPEVSDGDGDISAMLGEGGQSKRDFPKIWSEIMRFFTNPHKPMILALSRPDPKKNVTTLLKAFGECRPLRELANLTLILGNRDDIEIMSGGSGVVLTTVLKLVDRYDLYGQVAYPKHHKQSDVPEIYRLAAKTKGVFINPALVEPFGLTLIEAAAYGLPVVATKNGGPVDILKTLNNGLLVDPHDASAISESLLQLLADKSRWLECRRNGLNNIRLFSWPEHCLHYLSQIPRRLLTTHQHPHSTPAHPPDPSPDSTNDISLHFSTDGDLNPSALLDAFRRHHPHTPPKQDQDFAPGRRWRQRLCVIATDCYDIGGALRVGDLERRLMAVGGVDGSVGFVYATGCTLEETVEAMGLCHVEVAKFDALVCSSGAEVCYPWRDLAADAEYEGRLEYRWPGDHVKSAVLRLAAGVDEGASDLSVDLKASGLNCCAYSLRPGAKALKIDAIKQRLRTRGFRCNLIYTRACTRLNVIPLFASRHQALRYLAIRWGVDLAKMTVLVGQKGDTDREELLPGVHTSIVLGGLVSHDSESLLRDEGSYKLEDVAPMQSPNVVYLDEGCDAYEILSISAQKI